jgi:hypothetical protein
VRWLRFTAAAGDTGLALVPASATARWSGPSTELLIRSVVHAREGGRSDTRSHAGDGSAVRTQLLLATGLRCGLNSRSTTEPIVRGYGRNSRDGHDAYRCLGRPAQ